MKPRHNLLILVLLACLSSYTPISTMAENAPPYQSLSDVQISTWEKLALKKIYFGHKSVGNNIMEGVEEIVRDNPQIKLNLGSGSDKTDTNAGLFAHARVGQITDPQAMVDRVTSSIEQVIGGNPDIAILRFSYGDIYARRNVQRVFDDYKRALSLLKKKYPRTTFVHVTLPLPTPQTTWKTWIKKLMGKKEIWEYEDSIRKNEFNRLLRAEFVGREPLFDIAELESTYPHGRRSTFTFDGRTYYSMVPDYTYDDHHLNEKGRKMAAENLLLLLASIS